MTGSFLFHRCYEVNKYFLIRDWNDPCKNEIFAIPFSLCSISKMKEEDENEERRTKDEKKNGDDNDSPPNFASILPIKTFRNYRKDVQDLLQVTTFKCTINDNQMSNEFYLK